MTTIKLSTGIVTKHNGEGHISVYSPTLKEEPIYDMVTTETALRNQLKEQLINLHYEL